MNVKNEAGQHISDFVKSAIREKRKSNGRLGSKFTLQLYEVFDLHSHVFDELSEASTDEEDADAELVDKLSTAHDENPAQNRPKPLINLLCRAGRYSKLNYYALLRGSVEDPLLSHQNAVKVQVAVLGYVKKHNMHIHFAKAWDIVKNVFDSALQDAWELAAEDEVKPCTWMASKRAELSLYANVETIDALLGTKGKFETMPYAVEELAKSCKAGASLMHNAWAKCSRQIFSDEVKKGIKTLEDNSFDEDETASYDVLMAAKATALRKALAGEDVEEIGWKAFYSMFEETFPIALEDPLDDATYQYWSRVKTIAVKSGQVEPLSYEKVCLEFGTCTDVPLHLKIPAGVLDKIRGARETAETLTRDCVDLADVIKTITKAKDTLLDLDLSWTLDHHWLTLRASKMLEAKIKRMVLAPLPDQNTHKEFKQAFK